MAGRRFYDAIYRRGAPWEGPARTELVDLVTEGRLTPGRAVDLGCGSGANAVFLAQQGFEVTGVDFSPVALTKASALSAEAGVEVRWVEADLTVVPLPGVEGPVDLVVDYGTLDDLRGARRAAMATNAARLVAPGGHLLLWCFYLEIPWWRRAGARFPGGLGAGEEQRLFGGEFTIERLSRPEVGTGFACFLLTRD